MYVGVHWPVETGCIKFENFLRWNVFEHHRCIVFEHDPWRSIFKQRWFRWIVFGHDWRIIFAHVPWRITGRQSGLYLNRAMSFVIGYNKMLLKLVTLPGMKGRNTHVPNSQWWVHVHQTSVRYNNPYKMLNKSLISLQIGIRLFFSNLETSKVSNNSLIIFFSSQNYQKHERKK